MAAVDYIDFYILDPNYVKFNDAELVEDNLIRLIIQKYQVLIFTSNGDVMGDFNLGTNLVELLFETRLSGESVQQLLDSQIRTYIPEIVETPYKLIVEFQQDPFNYQDVMFISLEIDEFRIINQIGNFL